MEWVKQLGISLVPAIIMAAIGWGVTSSEVERLKEQQVLDTLVNNQVVEISANQKNLKFNVEALGNTVISLSARVSANEVTTAETIKVLESVSMALTRQTAATTKLTESVIRLEEKVNNLK